MANNEHLFQGVIISLARPKRSFFIAGILLVINKGESLQGNLRKMVYSINFYKRKGGFLVMRNRKPGNSMELVS